MTTLFISDLHLSQERPEKLDLFFQFLRRPALDANALYILGDLFEALVGDDDESPPKPEIFNALSLLTASGVALYVMPGNRDFLMGEGFELKTGGKLLPDPYVIELCGEKTLLMHGDLLCTKDIDYLKFRFMVRNPDWQQQFLDKPLPERHKIAQQLRAASKEAMKDKIPLIMDVEQKTVEHFMLTHKVNRLIHGHTHRTAVHQFNLNGKPSTRTVLGDWYQNENVLICNETDQKIVSVQDTLS